MMSYVSATNLKDRDIDVLVTVFPPPHPPPPPPLILVVKSVVKIQASQAAILA